MTQPHYIDRDGEALYVPVPLNADGDGPADTAETVRIEHQVWEAETNETLCTARDENTARQIVAAWNRRPAPMEAVAWREKVAIAVAQDLARQDDVPDWRPDGGWDLKWGYVDQGEVDFGEIADAVSQALAVIPTQEAAPAPDDVREAIARIIDPMAFDLDRYVHRKNPGAWALNKAERAEKACAKADAILAALTAKGEGRD